MRLRKGLSGNETESTIIGAWELEKVSNNQGGVIATPDIKAIL